MSDNYFQVTSLASGSKGNCFLVRTASSQVLIDVGISFKRIQEESEKLGIDIFRTQAVIISHEHSDHIKGAGVACRKLKIPLFITAKTHQFSARAIGEIPHKPVFFTQGDDFLIGDLIVHPFTSSHDAIDSSNFLIASTQHPERSMAIVTDVGYASNLLVNKVKNVTTLILESNHDIKLLLDGPYPWDLKQRVRSRVGHLSNEQAIGIITQIMGPHLQNLILAHLSEVNNTPEIAETMMRSYLQSINAPTELIVAGQYECTKLVNI